MHLSYGHTDVLLNRPAIAPLGEAKPNTQIFRELAAHMGFVDKNNALFTESDESLCRAAFGDKVDFEALLENGFVHLPVPDVPFANGNFPTSSGKCEFVSEKFGLPDYIPNYEGVGENPKYPLAMISPPARNFLNSSFVNVASLQAIEREPLIEINPADAQARGINDGDTVKVFNARGEYICKAHVTERARSGVVVGLSVWWRKLGINGTNVNELTSQNLTDMGEAPVFYDCGVEVAVIR